MKLTPNAADVAACGLAAQEGGADAVSLINTLRAMARRAAAARGPWLGAGTGGLSGPAIRTIALAHVAAVAARVSIPVVGMGGVSDAGSRARPARCGGTLVAIGTENFRDPAAARGRIARELGDDARMR